MEKNVNPVGKSDTGEDTRMRSRVAFTDDVLYAKEFITGDCVRKTGIRDFVLTPFPGRVVYSNTDTGVVMVQWPWGAESNYASELVHDKSGDFVVPFMDQTYKTWESARYTNTPEDIRDGEKFRKSIASSILQDYSNLVKPVYHAACKMWYQEIPEVEALVKLSSDFSDNYGFEVVRSTIQDIYDTGKRIAIYWGSSNRKYRMTKSEKTSGRVACPRCSSVLQPRTYRHARKIMQCRNCGFSIHNKDLM